MVDNPNHPLSRLCICNITLVWRPLQASTCFDSSDGILLTSPFSACIAINITPLGLYSSSSSIPTKYDDFLAEEATIPGRVQLPAPKHHDPSPSTSTKHTRFAIQRADESMKQIAPIDGSNTGERAVGRVKWVMDMLGPIAEVRVAPF